MTTKTGRLVRRVGEQTRAPTVPGCSQISPKRCQATISTYLHRRTDSLCTSLSSSGVGMIQANSRWTTRVLLHPSSSSKGIFYKLVSTKSAIRQGLYAPKRSENDAFSSRRASKNASDFKRRPPTVSSTSKSSRYERGQSSSPFRRAFRSSAAADDAEVGNEGLVRSRIQDRMEKSDGRPHMQEHRSSDSVSITYTTPASEFLYGTNVVSAALQMNRRKLYKFYVYQGQLGAASDQQMALRKLALERGVPIQRLGLDESRKMDKMSGGRPHNVIPPESNPDGAQTDSGAGICAGSLPTA